MNLSDIKNSEVLVAKLKELEIKMERIQRLDKIRNTIDKEPETNKLFKQLLEDYQLDETEMYEILLESGFGYPVDPEGNSQIFYDTLNRYCAKKYGKIGKLLYE